MKAARSLSGIYFRFYNPDTKKMENRCFEDLPESEQDDRMANAENEWLKSLVKQLAKTLNFIGDEFDITTEHESD